MSVTFFSLLKQVHVQLLVHFFHHKAIILCTVVDPRGGTKGAEVHPHPGLQ